MSLAPLPRLTLADIVSGSKLYHASPLHYVPSILADGALYAKDILSARHVAPRQSAARRDRMLGLGEYVHFSFDYITPLLLDKARRGYPHAVFVFDAAAIAELPGAGLLPYNTKTWRSKRALRLVCDAGEAMSWLATRREGDRLRSLEFLVKYGAGLDSLLELRFGTSEEAERVAKIAGACGLTLPESIIVSPHIGGGASPTASEIDAYFEACEASGKVLPPPRIRFD